MEVNQILVGDVKDVLADSVPFIDMTITSPPYWRVRNYDSDHVTWNDGWVGELGQEPTKEQYVNHMCDIFDLIHKSTLNQGSCWVNLGDIYFDKQLSQIPSMFAIEMCKRGWKLRNEIVWHKPHCIPHSTKNRFMVDFEKLFFFVKQDNYFFNQQFEPIAISDKERERFDRLMTIPETSEHIKSNMRRNKRSVWSISGSLNPTIHIATFPVELIKTPIQACCPEQVCVNCGAPVRRTIEREKYGRIDYESKFNHHGNSNEKSVLQKRRWLREVSKQKAVELYPNNKQLQLDYIRLMHAHGNVVNEWEVVHKCNCDAKFRKGIVFDPFMGSGTTAIAAMKYNRDWVGVEINPEYARIASNRIEEYATKNS